MFVAVFDKTMAAKSPDKEVAMVKGHCDTLDFGLRNEFPDENYLHPFYDGNPVLKCSLK